MSVALVITSESQAIRLLPWAWMFARSQDAELTVVRAQKRAGERVWREVETVEECERILPRWQDTLEGLPGRGQSSPARSGASSDPHENAASPAEVIPDVIDVSVRQLLDQVGT